MSKTIYTEETLNLLAQKDLEKVNNLVKQGKIKETELANKYLIIEYND
jgi:hypothetical protein